MTWRVIRIAQLSERGPLEVQLAKIIQSVVGICVYRNPGDGIQPS